jgi:hypothetical protein
MSGATSTAATAAHDATSTAATATLNSDNTTNNNTTKTTNNTTNPTTNSTTSAAGEPLQPPHYSSAAKRGKAAEDDEDAQIPNLPLLYVHAPVYGWTDQLKQQAIKAVLARLPQKSLRQYDSARDHIVFAVAANADTIAAAIAAGPVTDAQLTVSSSLKPKYTKTARTESIRVRLRNLPMLYTRAMVKAALQDAGAIVRHVAPDKLIVDKVDTGAWLTTAAVFVDPTSPVLPPTIFVNSSTVQVNDPRDYTAAAERKRAYEERQLRKRARSTSVSQDDAPHPPQPEQQQQPHQDQLQEQQHDQQAAPASAASPASTASAETTAADASGFKYINSKPSKRTRNRSRSPSPTAKLMDSTVGQPSIYAVLPNSGVDMDGTAQSAAETTTHSES